MEQLHFRQSFPNQVQRLFCYSFSIIKISFYKISYGQSYTHHVGPSDYTEQHMETRADK